MTKTNGEGEFCFEVSPGDYYITPKIADEEVSNGLRFTPGTKRVTVQDASVFDVAFRMMKLDLSGHVRCIDQDSCTGQPVSLKSTQNDFSETTKLQADGSFSFSSILPGLYEVEFEGEEGYCWDSNNDQRQRI